MDTKISKYLPSFYNGDYKLETTEKRQDDLPVFVQEYVDKINSNNAAQGVGGTFVDYSVDYAATIRNILLFNDNLWDDKIIDSIVTAATDTILVSKESARIKLSAVELLTCIVLKLPDHYNRNIDSYNKIFDCRDEIEAEEDAISCANISIISLKVGLNFLFSAMGIDMYTDVLELMPYVQNDAAAMISTAKMINRYLETRDDVLLPPRIDAIVLQNVLQWLKSDNLDIRYCAAKILLALARNSENESVVNHQLLNLIDSECAHIKAHILRKIGKAKGISDKTKSYIFSKCENDSCYVVRMVCREEMAAES